MPTRVPISATNFGKWLELQRGERSFEQIALRVRTLVKPTGLKVDQSLIYKIEKGRVPSWPILAALCRVYGPDIREVVLRLIDALEFPGSSDLLCPADGVQRASESSRPVREVHDAQVRTRQIADELRSLSDDVSSALQDVANRLDRGVSPPPTGRKARKA